MIEIKFSCPACNQHISCSSAYCDQAVHCPNCRTEIRVPCSAHLKPDRVAPEPKASPLTSGSRPDPSNATNGKTASAATEKELHCRCPVCQSHLRIPAAVAAQSAADVFPSAELVLEPAAADHPPKPAAPPAEAPTVMTEREKHIAAERAAREVSLYPKMKPRLNLVLGEKEKPAAELKDGENPSWMKEAA